MHGSARRRHDDRRVYRSRWLRGTATTILGFVVLVYLTVLKLAGEAIGHRPLLTLGVLFVVVGMQFLSLGLLSELITSHHEQRDADRERADAYVDEILR